MTNTVRGQQRKAKQVIKQKKAKRLLTLLLAVIIVAVNVTAIYCKTHVQRACEVVSVNEDVITLRHPNGLIYDVIVTDPESYVNCIIIDAIFNEMKDWDKNYEVVDINM